jgi:hypothetical protein
MNGRIRPAFSSSRSAWAFCALLAGIFLFPLLNQRIFPRWPYPASGLHRGPTDLAFLEQACAPASGHIDLLLVGDSFLRHGLDPHLLESELGAALGRPMRVVTLGFQHRGEEMYYLGLRRCLAQQQPALVIMDLPVYDPKLKFYDRNQPHIWAYRVLRTDEGPDFYRALRPRPRLDLYGQAVLGMPRTLLNALRTPPPLTFDPSYRGNRASDERLDGQPFVPGDPRPALPFSAGDALYSPATRDRWTFAERPQQAYSRLFWDKTRALLAEHHLPLAIVSFPRLDQRSESTVTHSHFWPHDSADLRLIGLPPALLYRGLGEREVTALYADSYHLNANGARYFTHAVAPAVVQLMREAQHAR